MELPEFERAAKLGRFLLIATGVVLIGVGAAFGYFAPGENTWAVVVAILVGVAQIGVAIAASDKMCASLGILAPWWP